MEFDGERFIPIKTDGDIELEHNHRYLLAADLVKGKQVLDIASGEGYGSALMAGSAAQVTGVDIDPKAVEHARSKYQAENLSFLQGDCANIPLLDNTVDVVVSFETIEHHTEHEQMMLEIKRVLKPGGLLIISSPDKKEYSDVTGQENHFHVRELYRDEFEQLLSKHFKNWSLSGQRVIYGSLIANSQPNGESFVSIENGGDTRQRQDGAPRAVYHIALASDQSIPELPNSSYSAIDPPYQRLVDQFAQSNHSEPTSPLVADGMIAPEFVDSMNKIHAQIASIRDAHQSEISKLESNLQALDQQKSQLKDQIAQHEMQAEQHQKQAQMLQDKIEQLNLHLTERQQVASAALERERAMLASKSWRVTSPLRGTRRAMGSNLLVAGRQTLAIGGKQVWALLPLSPRQRREAKSKLFRSAPMLFRWSATYQQWHKVQDDTPSPADYPGPAIIYEDSEPSSAVSLYQGGTLAKPLPARLICFYLPQFHPIAENNEWWGEGFTEWTNVKPAQKQFAAHYQPHEPSDLGYYDLLDPSAQRRQVALANLYGIGGFCFYFYWFAGKRLLEGPTENYLNDTSLNLPFCLCWANENWTRRWDGLEKEFLITQEHSPEDDIAFISHISKYLADGRYIKIEGKPLLIVYRPSLLPDATQTAKRWRDWCRENGIGEIYLASTQSFEKTDPTEWGFDASIEFPPNNSAPPEVTEHIESLNENFEGQIFDWRILLERSFKYVEPSYRLFRGVCPSWDNTARRKENATIFVNNTPARYSAWVKNAIRNAMTRTHEDERLVFVNAWNEWAEGAHLEPDKKHGYAYLEATRQALVQSTEPRQTMLSNADTIGIVIHAYYPDVFKEILSYIGKVKGNPVRLYVTAPEKIETIVRELLTSLDVDYKLVIVDNRGRDILPFLKILPDIKRDNIDLIVKVHTKKSTHREDGHVWRADLYEQLLSSSRIKSAIDLLNNDPSLGLIGANGHVVPMNYYEGSNIKKVTELSYRMGVSAQEVSKLNFCAGSMLVARITAFDALTNLAISADDFETEAGQVDGTLAHAIERLFSVTAYAMGYRVSDFDDSATSNYQFADRG